MSKGTETEIYITTTVGPTNYASLCLSSALLSWTLILTAVPRLSGRPHRNKRILLSRNIKWQLWGSICLLHLPPRSLERNRSSELKHLVKLDYRDVAKESSKSSRENGIKRFIYFPNFLNSVHGGFYSIYILKDLFI